MQAVYRARREVHAACSASASTSSARGSMQGGRAFMLRHLLPAIMPSWRFFDRIGPAPRVEVALIRQNGAAPGGGDGGRGAIPTEGADAWRPLRSEPTRLGVLAALIRLFWNPDGNESLFVVSCAERFLDDPTPAREALLILHAVRRLRADRPRAEQGAPASATDDGLLRPIPPFRLRIVETHRENGRVVEHVCYVSRPQMPGESMRGGQP